MNYVTYENLYAIMDAIKNKIGGGSGSTAVATVASAPAYYERESLPVSNRTTLELAKTWLNIADGGYAASTSQTLDITQAGSWDDSQYAVAANRVGKDFYIYACEPASGTAPTFILSHNSTIPTGYTAANSRKIGGFHCLCESVGTISGHTLSDYESGDILPNSIWDLKHRAISDNEGMVWIPEINLWVDIYFGSWNGSQIVSEFNGVPITGTSATPMHGLKFIEEYGKINKILPSYSEFMVLAKGTPEEDIVSTNAMITGAGGHYSASGQRMISNYGIEDTTGACWNWSRDFTEFKLNTGGNATTYRGAYWKNTNTYYDGYDPVSTAVYNSTIDSRSYGKSYGLPRQIMCGGSWGNGSAFCGSRCFDSSSFGSVVGDGCCGRGCSLKR